MSGVQTISVRPEEADIRLDRWFKRRFPQVSHARLQRLLRTGQVRVDGGRAKAGLRLAPGQRVRVPPLPDAAAPAGRKAAPPPLGRREAEALAARILHRDESVIALDKPAGLAVQGGTRTSRHLDAMLDALRFGAAERPRLVHRLDKDTSGVLLLARNARAAARLTAAFRGRGTNKVYWAVVVGVPKPRSGRIDLAVAKRGGSPRDPRIAWGPKRPGRGGERVAPDAEEGRRAVTLYRVVEAAGRRAAWLALNPLTGRTHQIRVHCAALGTPILGDGKYGGRAAFLPGAPLARRLHLHARAIEIDHPDGGRLRVTAPLPPHMETAWEFLGFDPGAAGDEFAGLAG